MGRREIMNKSAVTEQDIRLPQFRDAKLEDLEFDGSGEVVRKDRFEKSMRKISSMLHGVNGLSARDGWTCEQVVEAAEIAIRQFQRLKDLILIVESVPVDAEFYHFGNKEYVKDINQDDLDSARKEPELGHTVGHLSFRGDTWDHDGAWLEYIDVLVSISDIKKEILKIAGGIEHAK